jgi:hypothetical protein
MLFGFCSACKSAVERATERYLARRKRCEPLSVSHFVALPAHA